MRAGCLATLTLVVARTLALGSGPQSAAAPPPVPYEDAGACPFEGCAYREWQAREGVRVRKDRRPDAPILYLVAKGEKVTALTGVVITHQAGEVQFREPVDLDAFGGSIHVEPGDTLYLLTYRGEGVTAAWFKGKLHDDVDGSLFFDDACDRKPRGCVARIVKHAAQTWWVQVRNARGRVGWTDEPQKFDNKDALGR